MDRDIENRFVRTFLQKNMQDRIIFEFASDKKRKTAICRFCHTTDELVKPQFILQKSNNLGSHEILLEINKLSTGNECYVISLNEEVDGTQTTIKTALSNCIGYGMPSIIIVGEKVAIIETEQENGAAYKYIMGVV